MSSFPHNAFTATPRLPAMPGAGNWFIARIQQIDEILRAHDGASFTKFTVYGSPRTLGRLREAVEITQQAPATAAEFEWMPMHSLTGIEDEGFALFGIDDTNRAHVAILGLCFDRPVSPEYVETRWVLCLDGMTAAAAHAAATALTA